MCRRHAETSQKAMSEFSRLFGSDAIAVDEGGKRDKKRQGKKARREEGGE